MTKKEFATFAMALKTYYPKENLLPNEQAMELWYRQLQDIPYQVAETALNKWVALNKWCPTIADIRQIALEVTQGDIPDWSEGWEEVCKAIQRFGYYRPQEAKESLSPITRQVVERMGYTHLCMSENTTADRANFRVIYEGMVERKQKEAQIPEKLRLAINQLTQKSLIEDKEV